METTTRAQHTPGPWHTTEGFDGSWAIWNRLDGEGYGYDWLAQVGSNEANARLIASAPALLAALEALWEHLGDQMRICAAHDGIYPGEDDLAPLLQSAETAIAQARGDA